MKLGESKEDYLEAMYILKRQKGYVRNFLLCNYLNYSKASVSVAIRGLVAEGYVIKDEHGYVELTAEGLCKAFAFGRILRTDRSISGNCKSRCMPDGTYNQ